MNTNIFDKIKEIETTLFDCSYHLYLLACCTDNKESDELEKASVICDKALKIITKLCEERNTAR